MSDRHRYCSKEILYYAEKQTWEKFIRLGIQCLQEVPSLKECLQSWIKQNKVSVLWLWQISATLPRLLLLASYQIQSFEQNVLHVQKKARGLNRLLCEMA